MERKILIALINSTEFLQQVRSRVEMRYFESRTARLLTTWTLEYFDEYQQAPGDGIHEVYMDKLQAGRMDAELAEEIEQDILPDLQKQFKKQGINVRHLIRLADKFFVRRKLSLLQEDIMDLLDKGDVAGAEQLATSYKQIVDDDTDIDLSDKKALERVEIAFKEQEETLLYYPGVLGEFWNSQMVRGAFIGILAPEKRGKSFMLMDMATRGTRQGHKVAFFQAGDMTEAQQIRRLCVHLTKTSDKEKYIGKQYVPVKDCIYNQLDDCTKEIRECDFGAFEDEFTEQTLRKELTYDELLAAFKGTSGYAPCHNCLKYKESRWGVPWLKEINIPSVLTKEEAKHAIEKFYINTERSFKLSSHANGTLSIAKIKAKLQSWEMVDNFIPDIILIDYADLLEMGGNIEFRQKQNEIWKALRGLSQETNSLVISPTQADANSYEKDTLSLRNFSEDKRKYAHVTAFYGLNQDKDGREKKLNMMRINELVVREDDFDIQRQVVVLQKLSIGRPVLTSYWY